DSDRIAELKAAIIAEPDAIETTLKRFQGDAGSPPLAERQDQIARIFTGDSVEGIVAALEADGSDWAKAQSAALASKSPQTLKVTLRQMAEGARAPSFADNMRMEYRIAARVVQRHDFIEGVRAVIVDKDNRPRWEPTSLAGVTPAMLDAIFAPLPPDEEWSPLA
ncbi:MAG: enoyl-CoA hydratase/isomerase family protein, partial [Phenylobacterium sp.]|uniref:enoyl-CoA hydratase/isomerase family protein n=1 Tax=Phenylobacterium sp. TaxID=1871053 RepID=UPI0027338E42